MSYRQFFATVSLVLLHGVLPLALHASPAPSSSCIVLAAEEPKADDGNEEDWLVEQPGAQWGRGKAPYRAAHHQGGIILHGQGEFAPATLRRPLSAHQH